MDGTLDAALTDGAVTGVRSVPLRPSIFNVNVPLKGGKTLIYNTLTRSLDCLSGARATLLEALEGGSFTSASPHARKLIEEGFAIPPEHDDIRHAQSLYGKLRFDETHLQLVVAPTLGCNFKCDYCYQGLDKKHDKMTAETRANILRFIEERSEKLKSVEVHWYGGEPLNDRASIYALSDEIMAFCAARGLRYFASMVTNGYQLTGKVAEEMEARNLKWAQITLDGPKKTHDTRRILLSGAGSYDKIVKNIKEIMARTNLRISLRCNVDTRNIDSVYDLIDDLAEQGLSNSRTTIYFAPVQTMTLECADINGFVEEKRTYAVKELDLMRYAASKGLLQFDLPGNFMSICVGIKTNGWVIAPNGTVQKCFDTIQREDLSIGRIEDNLDSLADSPYLLLWRSWTPFDLPTCRGCKLLPSCGGSCAYKFIHNQLTIGDDTRLPCPSMKFSLAERMFEVACDRGMVQRADWDPERSPTTPQMMGASYTPARLDEAIGAFDQSIVQFEERASRIGALARADKLPQSTYEKLKRSKQDFMAMTARRVKSARQARVILRGNQPGAEGT